MSFINKLGKVLLGDNNRKHSHFNMSHSVNTTANVGDVFGVGCRYCYPDSKTEIDAEVAIQLSPVIAPFFGELGLELSYHFVEFADILGGDWYKAFLTKTTYASTSGPYVPLNLPRCTLGALARWCLVGANLSVFEMQADGTWKQPEYGSSEAQAIWSDCFNNTDMLIGTITRPYFDPVAKPLYVTCCESFETEVFPIAWQTTGRWACLPLALNGSLPAGATDRRADIFKNKASGFLEGHIDITPDSADYIHIMDKGEGIGHEHTLMFCWKFNAVGQRFAKLLESCGYKVDMDSTRLVSLMPLFSHYFAYWSRFGVQRYINYQDTNLAKLVKHMVENGYLTLDSTSSIDPDLWRAFMQDCSQMWYTDEVDFVSAHQTTTENNPVATGVGSGLYADVMSSGGGSTMPSYSSALTETSTSQRIVGKSDDDYLVSDNVISALDIEYLKRLYVWSQRNSVIGKRVDALLRSQGFGSWCDCQQSNFIGTDYIPISVSKQMVSSDTYNPTSQTGSFAGDYTGKAVGYKSSTGKKTFKNKSMGYLITLASIKVNGGMTQGLDGTLCATDVIHLPNQEFDGMGYECTSVDQIVGTKVCDDFSVTAPVQQSSVPFGLIPIYSQFKIARNIASGGFALRSGRNKYAPWTLDRLIPMTDRVVTYDARSDKWEFERPIVDANSLPKAGETWRHVYRYMWLANYNRIFRQYEQNGYFDFVAANGGTIIDWVRGNEDNFIVQMYVKEDYWANLKPINESFGTYDDEHKPNGSIAKA